MKARYIMTLLCTAFTTFLLAQPANNECEGAIPIGNPNDYCSNVGQFTNVGATTSTYGKAPCFADANGKDVWFVFTAVGSDATITVRGNRAQGGTLARPEMALYTNGCGGTISELRCESDSQNDGILELYRGGLTIGASYLIRVQGRSAATGTFQLCINNYNPPVEPGSDCSSASILCDMSSFAIQKVTGIGSNADEADNTCLDQDNNGVDIGPSESSSTWFVWTAATSGTLTFVITPLNKTDDIDFALFELPNGVTNCGGKRLLRCVATACQGPTGLNLTSNQTSEDINCNAGEDGFVKFIDMEAGKSYGLLINNFSNTGNGFKMDFDGTGSFQGPQADFTVSDSNLTACVGQAISFTDATTFALGTIQKWEWKFGVGASIAEANTRGVHTVSYKTPGLKSIVLTVTSDKGCVTTIVKTIQVECCPDHFTTSGVANNITCPGADDGAINVTVSSAYPPYTFAWDSTRTSEDLTNLAAGTYTVTITDQATCDTTLTFDITGPPPVAFDTTITKPTCGGGMDGSITLTVTGGTPPYRFNWQNTGFNSNNILSNISRGDYTVVVRDSNNCDTTLIIALKELELQLSPLVNAVTPPTCNGGANGSIQVNVVNGFGPFQYDWRDGRGFQNANSLTGLRAGTYSMDVRDANLCVGSFTFNMEDFPALVLTFDSTNVSCNGETDGSATAIAAGGVGNFTYAWSNGQRTATISDLADGNYTVIATDSNQCTITGTVTITEPAPVFVNVVSTEDLLCNGEKTGSITVAGTGGYTPYNFSINGGTLQPNSSFTQLGAGTYTITIEDVQGCRSTTTATLIQPPPLIVDAGLDTTIELGSSVDLQAIANASVNWQWTPSDRLSCSDCPNPTASPVNNTQYVVTISNGDSCRASDSLTVFISKNRPIFIPSAFSPNFDGANDFFTLFGGPAAEVIEKLLVFDRWGNLLFEGSNIPLGQEQLGWNGTFNGKPMAPGVFAYMAKVRFIDSEVILYEGDVTIVR